MPTPPKTKHGYNPYHAISALQKCIRRGVEYDALYWAMELCHSSYEGWCWNRLQVIACEDVGPANPTAICVVTSCRDIWARLSKTRKAKDKHPETNILAHAVLHLCRSEKSREADDLGHILFLKRDGLDPMTAEPDGRAKEHLPIPAEAMDGHTLEGKTENKKESKKTGEALQSIFTRSFREEGGRLNKPVRTVGADGANWTEELCKLEGTDIGKAFTPADSVAPFAPKAETLVDREYRMIGDGIFEIDAKEPGTPPYAINLDAGTCTCESFKYNSNCKHLAFMRAKLHK